MIPEIGFVSLKLKLDSTLEFRKIRSLYNWKLSGVRGLRTVYHSLTSHKSLGALVVF